MPPHGTAAAEEMAGTAILSLPRQSARGRREGEHRGLFSASKPVRPAV